MNASLGLESFKIKKFVLNFSWTTDVYTRLLFLFTISLLHRYLDYFYYFTLAFMWHKADSFLNTKLFVVFFNNVLDY